MARRKAAEVTEPSTDEDVTMTDVDTNVDTAADRAAQPDFTLEFVADLPENDKRRGGRGRGPSIVYKENLEKIRDEGQGAWGTVAKFHTATGAATALRLIRAGQKAVPDDVHNFEFQTRRSADEAGARNSVLFARYKVDG